MKRFFSIIYPYDLLVGIYCLSAIILSAIYGFKIDFGIILQWKYDITFVAIAMLYLIIHAALMALQTRRNKEDSVLFGPYWRKKLKNNYFQWRKLFDLIKVLLLLKVTLLIYCNIKQAIPFINSNLYDSELLWLDRVFHLGINPNTCTVKLLGNKYIAGIMDRIYISWYLVKPMVLVYFAIITDRSIHIRFFFCYFAMWIFGGLAALLIPSLGPIYTNPEWFTNLNIPFANKLQQLLLKHYEAALADPEKYKIFIYEGIAAFPSLHVGIVALFAFFLWKVNRKVGIAMFVYVGFIQIGSVLLGWHYAIDGYFSIGMACFFFRLSEKLVQNRLNVSSLFMAFLAQVNRMRLRLNKKISS
jgi:PAP2 superfamily protein